MYPIKAAAELAGLTPETLRAWERRHAAVAPVRDAGGRRLYDAAAIERLTRLHRLTDRGHPIRDLAALDDDALDRLLDEGRQAAYGGVEALPGRLLDAVADYRVEINKTLDEVNKTYVELAGRGRDYVTRVRGQAGHGRG